MKHIAKIFLRSVALVFVLFAGFAVSAVVSGVARPAPAAPPVATATSPADAGAVAGMFSLLCLCVLVSAVFSWAIVRSCLWGWKLMVAIYLAYFGLGTFMPQIESALFLPRHLPPGFVGQLFAMGAMVAGIFALAAVAIWGRLRCPQGAATWPSPSHLTWAGWSQRIAILAATYVAIYLLAGYYIAFRNPQLLAYYDTSDPGSFFAQLQRLWVWAPWFFAFQAARGVLWVAFALPLIVSFRGYRIELALLVGCLYTVWAVMLLVPNPYMPESVRMTHLAETAPSNFLFGCLVGWALGKLRAPDARSRAIRAAA